MKWFLLVIACACSILHADAIEDILHDFQVPGAAVGLIVDDKVVMMRGYGLRDVEHELPVTENTQFPIASCTKAFTALLLTKLADEGKISLDDPISMYIPELHLYDTRITIKDLLAHRTGIGRHDALWILNILHKENLVNALSQLEPQVPFRTQFLYNNLLYAVAGIVVEKVVGTSWEDAIKMTIFDPLNMASDQNDDDYSMPYAEIGGTIQELEFQDLSCIKAAGGINATLTDMLKWAQNQLSSSHFSKSVLSEMQSIHMPLPGISIHEEALHGSGLGWLVGEYRREPLVRHGGWVAGFCSEVALLPKQNAALVILTNSSTSGMHAIKAIRNTIFDRLLNASSLDWKEPFLQEYTQAKEALKIAQEVSQETLAFSDLIGEYRNPVYGLCKVSLQEGHPVCSFNNINITLTPKGGSLFVGYVPQLLVYGIYPYIDIIFTESGVAIAFEGFRDAKPIQFTRGNNGLSAAREFGK